MASRSRRYAEVMDPVTAIAAATTAFNTVKKLVNAGREIEDIAGQLGQWFTAASDIAKAEEEAKNPPLFKKLIHKGSVEEEALNATIARQKLIKQESELRSMIMLRYGEATYRDMIQMRRDIRARREQAVYRHRKRKKDLIEGTVIVLLIVGIMGVIGGFIHLLREYST